MDADVATQLALIEAIRAQEEAFQRAKAGNYVGAMSVINAATSALKQVGTARASGLAACYGDVAVALKDRASFLRGQRDYAASLYEAKRGRASGGAFMRFFSTVSQRTAQESFVDHSDNGEEKEADGDGKAKRRGGRADRSKTSRLPKY